MFDDAEIISRYTRGQAIADGLLVDLMQPETAGLVREAGFKWPVAMTATAFAKAVAPIADDGEPDTAANSLPPTQDLNGRLWDMLWMLQCAAAGRLGGECRKI